MGKVTYSDPDQEQNPSESLEMGSDILEMTLLWTGCYFTYAPNGNILYMNCKWLFMAWQLMAWIRIKILKPSLNNFLATELGGKKKHFCLNFHIKASNPQHLPQTTFSPPQWSSGTPLARDGSPSGAGDSRSARGPLRAPRSAHLGCHSEEGLFFCRLLPRNLLHHHGHSLIGRPSAFALQQRNQQWRQVSSGLRPPPAHALPTWPGGMLATPAPGSQAHLEAGHTHTV